MSGRTRPAENRPIGIVRRHPGRAALLAGAVAVALTIGLLVSLDGSIQAGSVAPSRSPSTTAAAVTAGEEPGVTAPSGGEAPTTGGAPSAERRLEAAAGARAPRSGAGDGGRSGDAEPVAPREPVRCEAQGAPTAAPLPSADERDGRRWVTVGRLTGTCDASSGPFPLVGVDTRLAWRSDADSFAVFVVDVAQGREASAGFADGQCAGPCSESQPVVLVAGRYTLEVQAGDGPWEVEVQEYRRP